MNVPRQKENQTAKRIQTTEETDCTSCTLPISSKCTIVNKKHTSVTARTADPANPNIRNTYEEHLTELPRLCSSNSTLTYLLLLFY